MGQLLTVPETAAILRLSPDSVYQLCNARKLRHQRVGSGRGKILILADAIDEYLAKTTVEVRSEEAAKQPPPPSPRKPTPVFKHVRID